MISNEREKCELISFKISSCVGKIAGLDLYLGNYQMMTLTTYVYAHFVCNDLPIDTEDPNFIRKVNSLVQDNIINGFARSGVPIPSENQDLYKLTLNDCLKEWKVRHLENSYIDDAEGISSTTTKMISEYFDSENIDYSDVELDTIHSILNDATNKNDDDTFSDYMKASTGSGCLVILLLLIPSIFILVNVIY